METFKLSVGSDAAKAFYFSDKDVGKVITNPQDQGDIGYLFYKRVLADSNWDGKQPIELVK
ncbi:hypothetical protein PR1_75 [Providencia phage vB_PreS_PR1]|uniref:Uncharacterized protein n=1 Tax=Providencia phage vB_PreS_PR1 TaxID=1931407 RepID=A0A1S6KVB0_9CAUD|nr:hypothetical protein FDH30_gp140 [Providencia phage vB_PreS_PR1]AQT25354.1 hypothetical protein PR1_75 [Providencia phage vB_PreS_PR1]